MKKHILIFLTIFLLLPACDVLDQYPHNGVLRSKLTADDIPHLYTGLYNYAQYKPTANGYLQGDFCGGDFIANSATVYASPGLWIKSLIIPTSSYISGPWNGYYACIYQINQFLALVESQPVQEPEYAEMTGTARFFRALMYYNLITRWGEVPLMRVCTDDPVPQSSKAECWAFVEEDLTAAVAACPDFTSKWYVSRQAAQALMARSLLAQGKKAEAAVWAEKVINSGFFALDDYSKIFSGEDNQEEIFSFRNKSDENGISFAGTFYVSSGGYVPTQDIIDEFGKNPGNRKAVAIKTYDGTTVLGKYINRGDEYHQLYIIRLAEMYLISAEGLGYDKGGLDRLNELRAKRGLVNKSITDEDTMLKAAVYERRLEFIGEGFRWFDLSRTGKTPDNLEDKYSILPIPTRELDLNPLLKQNTPWL